MSKYKVQLSEQIQQKNKDLSCKLGDQLPTWIYVGKIWYLTNYCAWENGDSLSFFIIFQRTKDLVFKGDPSMRKLKKKN